MRQMKTSLWDVTADTQIKEQFAKTKAVMLPGQ